MERREFLKLTLGLTAAAGAIAATAVAAQAAPMLQHTDVSAATPQPISPDTPAKSEPDDKGTVDDRELSSRGRHHHHHHHHRRRRWWPRHRHHRHRH